MSSGIETIRIGTRGSELALLQARSVARAISDLDGAPAIEEIIISTSGDRITDVPLSRVSGRSFFTKEIEEALLDGMIDVAVHSLKDLATLLPDGLTIGAITHREDPRDVLISREGHSLDDLPEGARIGTSSLRRQAFMSPSRLRTRH
ncbi:hydroxymethylbilane synthase [Gemmatimonadota bacterium]